MKFTNSEPLRRLMLPTTLLMLFSSSSVATTIMPLSVTDLLSESRLIVDATVIDVQSVSRSGAIHTVVTFQVHEVIKGDDAATVLEVSFLGGIKDGAAMAIAGLIYPEYGERGIYFLENPGRNQVNPILGWDQGHFIVDEPGAGDAAMIYTVGFRQVYGLDNAQRVTGQRLGSKTAAGVTVEPQYPGAEPMTIGEFKVRLHQILAEMAGGQNNNQLDQARD